MAKFMKFDDILGESLTCIKKSKKLRGERKTRALKNRTVWMCSAPGCVQKIAFDEGYGTVCKSCIDFERQFEPEFIKPIGEEIKKLHDLHTFLKEKQWLPYKKECQILDRYRLHVREILIEYGFIDEIGRMPSDGDADEIHDGSETTASVKTTKHTSTVKTHIRPKVRPSTCGNGQNNSAVPFTAQHVSFGSKRAYGINAHTRVGPPSVGDLDRVTPNERTNDARINIKEEPCEYGALSGDEKVDDQYDNDLDNMEVD